MAKTVLKTTSEVIDALGGNPAVMELCRIKNPQTVSNWRRWVNFPPRFFAVMKEALEAKGLSAPYSLWRMEEPESVRTTKAA